MKKSFLNVSLCECITDCIDKTDKATEFSTTNPSSFSAKERQFFLLLPNEDRVSKKLTAKLASKVSLTDMLDTGMVEQTKECINFNQLLTQSIAENSPQKSQPTAPSQTIKKDTPEPMLQVLAGF